MTETPGRKRFISFTNSGVRLQEREREKADNTLSSCIYNEGRCDRGGGEPANGQRARRGG